MINPLRVVPREVHGGRESAVTTPVIEDGQSGDQVDQHTCDDWEDAHHLLFQSANLCFAAAFLVPHRFGLSVLILRVLLSTGFLLVALWAGVGICAPDILAWNLTFLVTNCGHALYLAVKFAPPRMDPELMDLFEKTFVPLKVRKKHFRELVKNAAVATIEEEDHYAVEGITPADEKLSILVSGRMRATCENVLLHYIEPNEFLDSPEYEASPIGSDKLFQVTITAEVPSRYLSWSRRRLEQILKNNRLLDAVIYNLVGKDITHKLYKLNEYHRVQAEQQKSSTLPTGYWPPGNCDWWRNQIPRSLSVDAVHTGTKGRVRSLLWRTRDRRPSSGPSESVDSSPARPAHYSDPGSHPSTRRHYRGPLTAASVARVREAAMALASSSGESPPRQGLRGAVLTVCPVSCQVQEAITSTPSTVSDGGASFHSSAQVSPLIYFKTSSTISDHHHVHVTFETSV